LTFNVALKNLAVSEQGNFMTFFRRSEINNTQSFRDIAQIHENIFVPSAGRHHLECKKYDTKVKKKILLICRL
jgi:hypothetical protein